MKIEQIPNSYLKKNAELHGDSLMALSEQWQLPCLVDAVAISGSIDILSKKGTKD